ncbi:uncharacterized protein LY89DRAFT_790581 [Mollisia scopiformis]|uniref:Uncharacterized protein n=1 Tax=Mollisia scopiformis TaxID=149040 RepID=A0A132B303_MOLSC|nr:uncharacterized protein LY89DRAFT_790581 [Mollisia scopiformis]KUJ06419.1 hypothetical protein LY89DRAFT_790581 [Mollisia scopiformis]
MATIQKCQDPESANSALHLSDAGSPIHNQQEQSTHQSTFTSKDPMSTLLHTTTSTIQSTALNHRNHFVSRCPIQ